MKNFKQKKMRWKITLACLLVVIISTCLYWRFQSFELYRLNVDGHKRWWAGPVDSLGEEESYVLYHTFLKPKAEALNYLIDYHDRHISREKIERYYKDLTYMYFQRGWAIDKDYTEAEDESDILYDHLDDIILRCTYEIANKNIWITIDRYEKSESYHVPLTEENWRFIPYIRELEKHKEFLYKP